MLGLMRFAEMYCQALDHDLAVNTRQAAHALISVRATCWHQMDRWPKSGRTDRGGRSGHGDASGHGALFHHPRVFALSAATHA
jgi:hypothetical protein